MRKCRSILASLVLLTTATELAPASTLLVNANIIDGSGAPPFVADVAGTFLNTYWNTYAFFVMYANLDQVDLSRDVPVKARQEILEA